MEGHAQVEFFQTQVRSVLGKLLNVAVAEITHLFLSTVSSGIASPSVRNSVGLEGTLKSALEAMRNLATSSNDKSTYFTRTWCLEPQQGEESDDAASTWKDPESNHLLNNEIDETLWEVTGTKGNSVMQGNIEQSQLHIPEGSILEVVILSDEKTHVAPMDQKNSPPYPTQEDRPTTTSPPEHSNQPLPSLTSASSPQQESSSGLRIVSVVSTDSLKVGDLEEQMIAASTLWKPSPRLAPSEQQDTQDSPLTPLSRAPTQDSPLTPLSRAPTRLRAARRYVCHRVSEAKLPQPQAVKEKQDEERDEEQDEEWDEERGEERDEEHISLPQTRKGSEDSMEDFVLTLNKSSSSSPTSSSSTTHPFPSSSTTLPFPSPSTTLPSPSTTLPFPSPSSSTTLPSPSPSTTSPRPPLSISSFSPLQPRACSVRLEDIGNTFAPLAPLPSRHFLCPDCGRLFRRRRDFRRHRRFHTGEKPYGCARCHRFYALKRNLRQHQRETHSSREPHLCEVCGKQLDDLHKLKTHIRFHTGEKPHACTFCKKRFRLRKNLRNHVVEHTQCSRGCSVWNVSPAARPRRSHDSVCEPIRSLLPSDSSAVNSKVN